MATIRDVARVADVSIATVSRVLNGSDRVSDDASHRVWTAAAELDYWPNGAARSLTTSRTHALGVLLPDLYGDFFSEVIRGIDLTARALDHQILVSSSHANTDEVISAARSMRGRIDGLILMAPEAGSAGALERVSNRFPVVLLNPRSAVRSCSSVSIANHDGAFAVVKHLVELGHRSIAIIKGPPDNVDTDERLRGYRYALHEAGIEPRNELELSGAFTESSGFEVAAQICDLEPRPTAVFAANDCMAVGLLSALATLGISVPADMAVTGFDDVAIARYMNPPLTTVHVDAFELGSRAVHLLIAALGSNTHRDEVIAAKLVVRQSCGARLLDRPDTIASDTRIVHTPGKRPGRHPKRRREP